MFGLGLAEILIVMIIVVLAVKPEDIPTMARHLGRFVKRLRYMHYALNNQIDAFLEEDDSTNNKEKKKDE